MHARRDAEAYEKMIDRAAADLTQYFNNFFS
jgi:hypothetical protein